MKKPVYIIAAAQVALLILFLIGSNASDPAGNAMAQGFIGIAGFCMALFLIPAILLASSGKKPTLALILAIIPGILLVFGLANV